MKYLTVRSIFFFFISILSASVSAREKPILTIDNAHQLQPIVVLNDGQPSNTFDLAWSSQSEWLTVGRAVGAYVYSVPTFGLVDEPLGSRAYAVAFSPTEPLFAMTNSLNPGGITLKKHWLSMGHLPMGQSRKPAGGARRPKQR